MRLGVDPKHADQMVRGTVVMPNGLGKSKKVLVIASGEHKTVWIAGRAGVAERRDVTLAEAGDEALIASGLQVGDEVIVDAPASLRPGAAITVER